MISLVLFFRKPGVTANYGPTYLRAATRLKKVESVEEITKVF
jgi:hypothetical protein